MTVGILIVWRRFGIREGDHQPQHDVPVAENETGRLYRSGAEIDPDDYFAEATLMDLDDLEYNTRDGLRIASLAGAWIVAAAGFG
jgi:hypothetical protein